MKALRITGITMIVILIFAAIKTNNMLFLASALIMLLLIIGPLIVDKNPVDALNLEQLASDHLKELDQDSGWTEDDELVKDAFIQFYYKTQS